MYANWVLGRSRVATTETRLPEAGRNGRHRTGTYLAGSYMITLTTTGEL